MSSEPSLQFAEQPSDQPPNTTILITNEPAGEVWIALPQTGNLWVGYEYQGEPATAVYIWHQGGSTTKVPPGFNTFPVAETDALVYQLAFADQAIKLGWAYV